MYETGTFKNNKAAFDLGSFFGGSSSPVSDFGIYTGGTGGAQGIKANAVAQFHNNNTAAGAKMLSEGGGASSGGSNNLISNLSSKGGAMGATALGLPPEAGSLVGGLLGNLAQGSGKWVDDRPGQRENGWGVKPSTYSSFAFTYNGENYVLKDWGTRKSYWNPNDKTDFTGFAIYKNGKMIADHAKYVWQENGKLYMQNNLAPWDYKTAGKVMVYLGQPGKDWEEVGEGIDPNPKAFTGFTQANNTAGGSPSTQVNWNVQASPSPSPSPQPNITPSPSPANPSGQPPSGGFPIVGGEFDWRKYIPGYEDKEEPGNTNANKENTEKKDNTLYWVIGGVALLIFIAVMVFAFKK